MVDRVLPCGMPCVMGRVQDVACSVCLQAVAEVRGKEGNCVRGEVEVVPQVVEELLVRDRVVGFGQVDVDGEGRFCDCGSGR